MSAAERGHQLLLVEPTASGAREGIETLIVGVSAELGIARREIPDADAAAHSVTAPGQAGHRAVLAEFGSLAAAADGSLDRQWLREPAPCGAKR